MSSVLSAILYSRSAGEREDSVQTHDIEQGLPETVSLLDKLRMAIYHGEFTPGQRLVESELSQKYETSRGAVREALALLQNEGLVIRQRNRSAWVRPVTLSEAIEITEVRAVVEGLCAAKAAARATKADHRELRRMAEEMTEAVKRGDVLTDSRISDEIHAKIRAIAGQVTAARILDRLRYQDVRYQFHVSLLPGRLVQGHKEHMDIIDAVIAGDPVAAEQITRDHFASVIDAMRRLQDANLLPVMAAAFGR
jgi:DNA-binding GntR family transcriptional regulator